MGAKIEYTSFKFVNPPLLSEEEFIRWKAIFEHTPDVVISSLEYSQWDIYNKEFLAILIFGLIGVGIEFLQLKGNWIAIQAFAVIGVVAYVVRWFKSLSTLDQAISEHNEFYAKLKQDIISALDYEQFKLKR
jgi:hypothetical protein